MTRWLSVLFLCAAGVATYAAPSRAITPFDCTRVITPAQWRAVIGTSIKVQYGENDHDCNWFHRRPGGHPNGAIEGYPAGERNWHKKYRDDRPRTQPFDTCMQIESTRARLHSFGGTSPGSRSTARTASRTRRQTMRAVRRPRR